MIHPGEQVEKGGLASAIGADDSQNLPANDVKINVVDGGQSPEEFAQIPDLQKMAHRFL
jgi:hypothetical protein